VHNNINSSSTDNDSSLQLVILFKKFNVLKIQTLLTSCEFSSYFAQHLPIFTDERSRKFATKSLSHSQHPKHVATLASDL